MQVVGVGPACIFTGHCIVIDQVLINVHAARVSKCILAAIRTATLLCCNRQLHVVQVSPGQRFCTRRTADWSVDEEVFSVPDDVISALFTSAYRGARATGDRIERMMLACFATHPSRISERATHPLRTALSQVDRCALVRTLPAPSATPLLSGGVSVRASREGCRLSADLDRQSAQRQCSGSPCTPPLPAPAAMVAGAVLVLAAAVLAGRAAG